VVAAVVPQLCDRSRSQIAQRLRANLELNEAAGIVDVVAAACALQKGEITFYLHPRIDGWCRLSPPAEGDTAAKWGRPGFP
jgi:hypothetical protein